MRGSKNCVDVESTGKSLPRRSRQIFAAAVATIGAFGLGTVLTWSASALPDLRSRGDLGDLTSEEISWMASIAMLGALVSAPAAGFLMSYFGRKLSMLLMAIPYVIGWALIGFAVNVSMIYVGRVLTGFAGGAYIVLVPIYVGETADPKIRGALSTLMTLMMVSGALFTFVVGTFVSWSTLSIVSGLVLVLLVILMPFAPETPRYLVSQKKIERAIESLVWLRGANDEIEIKEELEEIQESVRVDKESTARWRDLFVSSSLKPTGISLVLFTFQQLCGANVVAFYTVEVYQAAGTNIDPNLAAIIVAICQMLTVLIPTFSVDRVGRKTLMLVSEVIMVISLSGLTVFFYFKENDYVDTTDMLSWLPLVCLIAFIIGYNIGMGPIPWVVTNEILPSQSRALGSAVVNSFAWILKFVSAKIFHSMIESLGWTASYVTFAVICIAGALFIYVAIPETRGKSLADIQRIYKKPSKIRRDSFGLSKSDKSIGNEMRMRGVDNIVFHPDP